ncbi:hypothetical protein WR25_06493 isoform B [Diploscapter pachys]|uniref:Dendritic cell-specific transmembrane protein-like domain-containing protein n=1 Tax=Diploscapter pachys TaxID=2018661 RepID=A0A2A2J2D6_9BILA|nr:hypothetical protein WR25_06493 isoform B [Diploscapter pachys]
MIRLWRKKCKAQRAADDFLFAVDNLESARNGLPLKYKWKEKMRQRLSIVLPFLKKEEEKGDGLFDRMFTRRTRQIMFYFVIAVQRVLSTRSRRLIILIVIVLSFEGPGMNILENLKETASSAACVQVNVLAAKRDISNYGKGLAQVKSYLHAIDDYMMQFVNIMRKVFKVTANLTKECKRLLRGPYKMCRDVFSNGYSTCMDKARYFSVAGGCSIVRSIEKICEVAKAYGDTVCSVPTMVKNGIKDSVVPMYETTFINTLNIVRLVYSIPRRIVDEGYGKAKQYYINVNDAAHMRIEFKSDQDDLDDESVGGLRERITRSLGSILSSYQKAIVIISNLIQWFFIPATILYSFIATLHFIYKYNYHDEYRNCYLTSEFDRINLDVQLREQPTALPLEEHENEMYIRRTAWKMNSTERPYFGFYLMMTILSFITPFFIFLMDIGVYKTLDGAYFILNLTNIEAPAHYELKASGNTTMSGLLNDLTEVFSPLTESIRSRDSAWRKCFSPPNPPDYVLFSLVIAAFILCIFLCRFQASSFPMTLVIPPFKKLVWLSRQALSTADYFFPERVRVRALFLYSKILEDRRSLLSEMLKRANPIVSGEDESVMRRAMQSRGYQRVDCCRCGAADMSLRDEANVRICGSCGSFYCVNCFCLMADCKNCNEFMQQVGKITMYYEEDGNVSGR